MKKNGNTASKQKLSQSNELHKPGYVRRFIALVFSLLYLCVCLFLVLVTVMVTVDLSLDPNIKPLTFQLPDPPVLRGSLKLNTALRDKSVRILEDRLLGPESIAYYKGHLYTGTYDGKLLDIYDDDKIRVLAQFGQQPCGSYEYEPTCGRPLGMRVTPDGKTLYVVDAYLGLYAVSTATGKFTQLMNIEETVGGERCRFLNDLDISSDGHTIYMTDSSTRWERRDFPYAVLEHQCTGRIIKFDTVTKAKTVLAKNLCFPNGIQLSPNENHLVFSELGNVQIMRYHLTGPKAGETEVFSSNLPGMPDNVRPSESGGYWVGLYNTRHAHKFSLYEATGAYPWARSFISKILSSSTVVKLAPPSHTIILELNSRGEIIRSLQDPAGEVTRSASEVLQVNDTLYIGSFNAPYILKTSL